MGKRADWNQWSALESGGMGFKKALREESISSDKGPVFDGNYFGSPSPVPSS
jgi:hypothetical protein